MTPQAFDFTPTPSHSYGEPWSDAQALIFDEFAAGPDAGNCIIRARAGTGKTTTVVHAARYAPEGRKLFVAFNKSNRVALQEKLQGNGEAKTSHGLGLGIVKRYWENVGVDFGRTRREELAEAVCGRSCPDAIKKLVAELHSKGREILPHASKRGDLIDLAYDFELTPDAAWTREGFGLDYVEAKALEAMELACTVKPRAIDGADMIFLPLRNRWVRESFDLVVIDEAQDWTAAQLELAQGVCRGRIIAVGDDRQAIYAFRGAAADALDNLKRTLRAKELGLKTTYRCARNIVREAQALVPDFEAGPDNSEGIVGSIERGQMKPEAGDFILSRSNAPLVAIALGLLRRGVRAKVAGKEHGIGLVKVVRKLATGNARHSIPALLAKVVTWRETEVKRFLAAKKDERATEAEDRAEMITELARGAKSVPSLLNDITALFEDLSKLSSEHIVTCSTVHKAKGFEAPRVFMLNWTFRDGNIEEDNIRYVAITRAKNQLTYVNDSNS